MPNGLPGKTVEYWSLAAWLTMMLADPNTGPEMMSSMAAARDAATKPHDGISDWYDGENFRQAVAAGCFTADSDVALSLSTNGFEAFRQNGHQGWPVVATVLNLSAARRSKIVCQILLTVTPGPKQPADLESFLEPIADQLNQLAAGLDGVYNAGSTQFRKLRAFQHQWTTDMPGGDKLGNATGHNGFKPNRFRDFHGVLHKTHMYFPPRDAGTGEALFGDNREARGTAASVGARALEAADSEASGMSMANQTKLAKMSGNKGYSLIFSPRLAQRASYPHLGYFWRMGPAAVPYDIMHMLLLNVCPLLWQLFAGHTCLGEEEDEDYVLPKGFRTLIGRELAAARQTVPVSQARSLRSIDMKFKSYKAVDWMYFLLSTGEVLLADRLPDVYFNMFMELSKAARLLVRPGGITVSELHEADVHLQSFQTAIYTHVYRGQAGRLPVCRSTVATVMDIVPNIKSCGPAWVSSQFPMERHVGVLARLITSRSNPHANLCAAIRNTYLAELVTGFGETNLPKKWAAATGENSKDNHPKGSFVVPNVTEELQDPVLLPPCGPAKALEGQELGSMRDNIC